MQLHLEWLPPISLRDGADQGLIYTCDYEDISVRPGVYIFGRLFGSAFEALYVGKATSLQARVKTQFNNLRLMTHIRNAKIGQRILLLGEFTPLPGQRSGKCLPIMERALIRHFLERHHDLVNVHGIRLKTHEIHSTGAGIRHGIPPIIIVDR